MSVKYFIFSNGAWCYMLPDVNIMKSWMKGEIASFDDIEFRGYE